MSEPSFVHLHNHTEFSMLDGAAKVDSLFGEAARLGMPAIAHTDHGNMFATWDCYQASKKHGVKSIVGVEAYVAPRISRKDKRPVKWGTAAQASDDVSGRGAYTHMTMWAENTKGMHNIFTMQSLSSIEGMYQKNRIDRELLSTYGAGVLGTTGCPSGEVQTFLRLGMYDEAVSSASDFRDILGAGNYYLELMEHGLSIERRVREDLLRLAKDLGLPLVATNDLHYTFKADAEAHDSLLCVSTSASLDDPNRFRFDSQEYYLKSPQEMRSLWHELPEACDNTLIIAERCAVEFTEGADLMPRFPVPEGENEASWFTKEVNSGLARRYPDGVPEDRVTQAAYETRVINQMGFPGYFLVTADFIGWAKSQGIRVGPGRGSGAGSIVAYALGITDLDPIVHGLLFERFLNPDRVSMPDFDVDFDERRRGEVITYVTKKYGADRVAQIVTMSNIKSKAAVKDATRILDYPFAMGNKITKVLPPDIMGKGVPLKDLFDPTHKRYGEAAEFRTMYDTTPDVKRIVDVARGLEGLKRGTGVHAAGVIMSAEPLIEHIPIMMRAADGAIITQFEYPVCETLGMVKFDFLGLSNLTTIDDTLINIKMNRGIDLDLEGLTLDDPKTYALVASGETSSCFQLESAGIRSLLRAMQPDHFEHISAVLALYRPGPMGANAHTAYADRKTGRAPVIPIHPELAEPLHEILGDTYGLIVYQEQVMAIAQKLAGFTLGQADMLRRAMGKKKKEILDKEFVPFRDGMVANGYSPESVQTLWDILVPFSDYAFNKAHTAAYGLITYWTAYLKANYPAEYMAAVLTTNSDDKEKTAIFLNECRRMRIEVLSPDVNESNVEYLAVGDSIRVGLGAVRAVGDNVVASIVRGRQGTPAAKPFTNFGDFIAKIDNIGCQKRPIESLIKAGAFDSLGHKRRALTLIYQDVVDQATALKKKAAQGQDDLFGMLDDSADLGALAVLVPDGSVDEWDKNTLLGFEREMLGLYVSDHPLRGVADSLAAQADTAIVTLLADESSSEKTVTLGGIVSSVVRKVTAKGDPWAAVTLEDLDGSVEVLAFPNTYQQVGHLLTQDAILLVTGKVKRNDDGSPKVFVTDVRIPTLTTDGTAPVTLYLAAHRVTRDLIGDMKEVFAAHPGTSPVLLQVTGPERFTTVALGPEFRVASSPGLTSDLKVLLGSACLG